MTKLEIFEKNDELLNEYKLKRSNLKRCKKC